VRKNFLPFSPPSIGEEEVAEVVNTLRSNWIGTGPKTFRFEKEFAAAVNAPAALALSSCTAAMHLALVTLGIGPGDFVLTTAMTFCSGVHVIEQVGAVPVLIDVEPDTLNIDPEKLNDTILDLSARSTNGSRLKALVPVHLYGHPCEMDRLLEIARQHHLAVIEDAAHALPARYKGCPVGSQDASCDVPRVTCFSFYATKNMTTGEGGMLTGSVEAIEIARAWSLHGMSRDAWNRHAREGSWHYDVDRPGFKYNMTDIQSSIGLHQLAKLSRFHARRQEIVQKYNAAFSRVSSLQIPSSRSHVDHAWHLYVLRLNGDRLNISRNQFIEELGARNISSSVHFIPIHLHSYYRDKYGHKAEDFPVACHEYRRMIPLPLYAGMSDQDADDVIEAVIDVVEKHGPYRKHQRTALENLDEKPVPPQSVAFNFRSLLRNAFDRFCAIVGLALLAPLFAMIALVIKLDDGGPVFYSQYRVGKGLGRFRLLKFRSMILNPVEKSPLTAPADPRITRAGRFLRKYKLDELPQLVNVVKGEMQLVGVRPQMARYVEKFPREYKVLLQVPPGITDPASLSFRHEEQMFHEGSIEEQYVSRILPSKLQLSLKYHRGRTFLSDIDILFRTVLGFKSRAMN
jgi:dTDP-4-amino-4,6-dideoxygalactose transaminase/lipopolysaccharide/colanic/teichoic acid biosynthesis glycosyltransferase